MSPVVLVCPVVSLMHHHGVQAVALLLHGHLLVHTLDPQLTITQVGLKAPKPLLDHRPVSPGRKTSPQAPAPTPLSSSFILRDVFINLKRCSSTKLPKSTDQFPFRRHFCEHLISLFKKRPIKRDKMTAMRRGNLYFNFWRVRLLCPSSGLDYQNKVGWGDT